MSLTLDQALAALQGQSLSVAQLKDIVRSVSGIPMSGEAATIILYSGATPDGIKAWLAAQALSQAGGGAWIDNSHVAKFLGSDEFEGALKDAIARENGWDIVTNADEITAKFNFLMNGTTASGVPRTSFDAMWDIASRNFVTDATGSVRLITTPAQSADEIANFLTSEPAKTELSLKAAV